MTIAIFLLFAAVFFAMMGCVLFIVDYWMVRMLTKDMSTEEELNPEFTNNP